jgi:hypothetical protein
MSRAELIAAGHEFTGGNLEKLSSEEICRLITISQHVTDLCLNEFERRGELAMDGGAPVVPYQCDYMVETVLTRRPTKCWP